MAVTEETPIASSLANGVTTLFPHLFTVLAASDLVVQGEIGGVTTVYTLGVDYSVNGVGASSGSVQFVSPPASGTTITRYRDTALERETDYQNNGDLQARTVNLDIDRLWLAMQDIFIGGKSAPASLRVPNGETVTQLPAAASRSGYYLGFDGSGQPALLAASTGTAAALAGDLSDSTTALKGDALVALKRAIADAVGTTLHAWIERHPVSPLDFGAVGDGVTDDAAAFTKAAAANRPIVLPSGYNFVISSPVTISADMRGYGMDTGQSTITLTGTGQLNVGDEHCDWGGFTVQSAVNNLVFINIEHSYFRSTRGLRLERQSGATGQKGLRFNTSSRSVYQTRAPLLKTSVDYPVFITGAGAEVFNNNHIGGPGSYFQNFASAITSELQLATDANVFEGYFETGTNFLSHNAGALRQNRFRYILDGVTRDLAVTPTVTDANLWERLDGGLFVVSGTFPQNQVFIGIPVTKVRATQSTAQSINTATPTAITFDAEVFDTLSELTPGSGLFTAKQTGYYRVRGAAMSASVAWDVGERWEVAVFKNGAEYARGVPSLADAATTRQRASSVDCLVLLAVNDTIDLRVLHNQGAAVTLNNSGLTNFLEIERVQ